MPLGDRITTDWQVEARDKLLGPGTPWRVGGLEQFMSRTIRSNDTPRAAAHGSVPGVDYIDAGAKILKLNCGNGALTQAQLLAELDALSTAWAPGPDDALAYQLGGQKRRRHGRFRDIDADLSQLAVGYVSVICEFIDEEGLAYSAELHSTATGLPTPGAGFEVPFEAPFTLPAGSGDSGVITVTNGGTVPAPWSVRLDGPLENPTITHQGQERTLAFTANGGLSLASGEHAVIDSSTRTVLLDETADRRSKLAGGSSWFSLDPADNTISFAGTGSGLLTISWRDTYL